MVEKKTRSKPTELIPLTGMYDHYVYRHISLITNKPFYIGVGTVIKGSRGLYNRARCKNGRRNEWMSIASKGYKIQIIFESNDYVEVFEKEKEFISLYGRSDTQKNGLLCNGSDGGIGNPGTVIKDETRKLLCRLAAKKRHTQETKDKISAAAIKRGYKSENNTSSKEIFQYDINGKFVKRWGCYADVKRDLGIHVQCLNKALKLPHHYAKLNYWYGEYMGGFVPTHELRFNSPIIQVTVLGEFIKEFKHCNEAAKELFNNHNLRVAIRHVVMGQRESFRGLYFKYKAA